MESKVVIEELPNQVCLSNAAAAVDSQELWLRGSAEPPQFFLLGFPAYDFHLSLSPVLYWIAMQNACTKKTVAQRCGSIGVHGELYSLNPQISIVAAVVFWVFLHFIEIQQPQLPI
jgi:hypothetical protein